MKKSEALAKLKTLFAEAELNGDGLDDVLQELALRMSEVAPTQSQSIVDNLTPAESAVKWKLPRREAYSPWSPRASQFADVGALRAFGDDLGKLEGEIRRVQSRPGAYTPSDFEAWRSWNTRREEKSAQVQAAMNSRQPNAVLVDRMTRELEGIIKSAPPSPPAGWEADED